MEGFNHLEDDGFADDIALLSHSLKDMQEKTTQIEMHGKTVRLKINYSKSKKMRINANTVTRVQISNMVMENVQWNSDKVAPIASASPDQKIPFDPSAYTDPPTGSKAQRNAVSRMSRKSLREITNPCTDGDGNGPYDFSKYTTEGGDLTESFEAGMFASMRRQTEAAYQDISPRPVPAPSSTTLHSSSSSHQLHINTSTIHNHLYSESPATTSDDDTSFSTWKAPAPNQAHNYHEEMKSRRSSDTLTSSNPRSGTQHPQARRR
ncbi:hypothetical protein ElyMa_000213800 [Elysia marginata]|uniref:Reverse transcriptase domain-containing protein n=1 Tax=Elysia marginata TaxID=1093978 RepID=A0AAV4EXU9_9GAST|nr:hypothetical protein ElyMa_000213800 [Elysia marginata]